MDKSGSDDYDDYNEEVEEKRKGSTVSSPTQPEEPYKTQEYTEKSDVGRTIVLKCLGEDLDSSSVFMWYNGSKIIAQGDRERTTDKRIIFSKNDGLLTIRAVNSYDDGQFRCHAFSKTFRYKTIIQVHVDGPPRGIVIGHNINEQENIAGKTLVYRAGKVDLRFNCYVEKARPQAKIVWSHNGNTLLETKQLDHDLKIEDEGILVIKTLHARHAGEYQCQALNDFGSLKALFKVEVQCKYFTSLYFFLHDNE